MTNKTTLEVGDVVLISESGWGFCEEDVGKYVELVDFEADYYGAHRFKIRAHDCVLFTERQYDYCGMDGYVRLESFGDNPLVLFNVNDGDYMADTPNDALLEVLNLDHPDSSDIISSTLDKHKNGKNKIVLEENQYTGGSSDYYKVFVMNPTTLSEPYESECNDIIEALNMTFAEGNAFKAIWRKAKARQGVKKKGYDNGIYDSEKVVFFGERMLIQAKNDE